MSGVGVLVVIGIALGVIVFIAVTIMRAVGKKPDKPSPDALETHFYKECAMCGWKGTVSKYVRKCPNCGEHLV